MEKTIITSTNNLDYIPTYIYLYRKIPDWLTPTGFRLLAEFATRARWKDADMFWNGEIIHLNKREFITGRIKLAQEIGITEGEYRSWYRKFVRVGYIRTIRTTRRCTIASFHADNVFELNIPQELPSQQPSDSPPNNQPVTTNNNDNNDNKDFKSRLEENDTKKSQSSKDEYEHREQRLQKMKEEFRWLKKF